MGSRHPQLPAGFNVLGYLNHVIGLGESARQFVGALRAADVPCAAAAIDLGEIPPRRPEAGFPWYPDAELPFDLTVLWINPDRYGIDLTPADLPGRLIGRWACELSVFPQHLRAAAQPLTEVWTASSFVRRSVGAAVAIPVRVIPMAVAAPPVPPLDRARWNVPAASTLFLYLFDHRSVTNRKNPLGLIRAFQLAFPGERRVHLLIKSLNARDAPQADAEMRAVAAAHPAIQIVDAALPERERLALLAGCDCYVSLHRSEGFGMTIAEAMAYGRPVIATDYGGSRDFVTSDNAYPVRWTPTRVGVNAAYPADAVWAEPDLDHAAALMREVVAEPDTARARGSRAAADMAAHHAPGTVGEQLKLELRRLSATQ